MSSINILKRQKDTDHQQLKKSQSQQLFNKTTKRKPNKKNVLSTIASKSTLVHTNNTTKLKISNKKTKTKNTSSTKNIQRKSKQSKKTISQLSTKTRKKSPIRKRKQIIQKQQELTERKKIHLEYFMYKDTYLPIENTQQRKIIYKIQLIDQKALKSQENRKKSINIKMVQKATQVQNKTLIDTATQRTDRKLYDVDFQCQTQQEKQPQAIKQVFEEEDSQPGKCLAETLSELQFLYLPDTKNFEGFSPMEKTHYKQLLIQIAKKFDDRSEPEIYNETTIEMFIKEREMKQRGIIQSFPMKGFPTHTLAVVSYISNLFCYLQINERSIVVDRINYSYGYELLQKFQRVREDKPTKRSLPLIPEATFWRFQSQLHQGLPIYEQHFQQALHSHNHAIFDAVNQILVEYQPYYHSRGEPFPWSRNFETTFFCIDEQNFGALASQVKDRIWQYSNYLAGVILQISNCHNSKVYIERLVINQTNMMNSEIKKQDERIQLQEQKTRMFCEIADQIQNELINQLATILSF